MRWPQQGIRQRMHSQCSAARHTCEMARMGNPSEKAVSLSGAHLASVDRLVAPAGLEPNSELPAAPEKAQLDR